MEKRLRSSLRSSAEEFLAAAVSDLESKNVRSILKASICSITPSSDLCSSLPAALHHALSRSLDSFKNCGLQPQAGKDGDRSSPSRSRSPPVKRARRSEGSSPCTGNESAEELQIRQLETMARLKEIRRYACVAHLCVSHPKKSFAPSDFLPCVRSLHDCLVLFETDEELLLEVASLCEKWWKEKLPEREALISQSLPFLLSRSLTMNKKTYVHRIYAVREAFLLFDFLDESIEDLKLLLLRCVITPLYVKTDEGRRFIAFMLTLNGKLQKEALALIKSQIPFGRKTVLEAYSDILFRFWKHSEDTSRSEIEDGFLQMLIDGAIYASSKSLANSIRRVLRGLIDNRATDGVDKLLFRLAEPILFRSLQVANSNVRQNALHLLIDLFPLENPDATREEKTVLLEKQSFLLERLLSDDSPDIRSVAVEGCCRVLHLYWEVLPSSTITEMLTKIIDDISHDSSNDVKLSTLKGITYLLGNPQTLEVLKVLLPRLGFMFLDPFLSVRIHICDLLLAARAIRSFQFNKVVDLDILLSSLANDHPLVAQKIVTLLIPSYFPSKMATRDACARFIALIKRSPAAGARFCEFARAEGSSPKSLIELAKVCYTIATSSEDLTPGQKDGLFMAAAHLCRDLSGEAAYKSTLAKFFSKEALKSLLPSITVRAQNSILTIVSSVHPEGIGDFHEHCMQMITSCSSVAGNLEIQSEVRRIHRLMISNGWSDDLFGALADALETAAIEAGTKVTKTKTKTKKKKKKRKNKGEGDYPLLSDSAAAWQVKDLLAERETRSAALTSPFLESISSSLGAISRVVIEKSTRWEGVDLSPLVAYASLCLHRPLENVEEGLTLEEILEGLLDFAEKLFWGVDPREGQETPSSKKVRRESPPVTRSRKKETRPDSSSHSPVEGAANKETDDSSDSTAGSTRVATFLLKFIADAATLSLIPATNPRWPLFASAFLRHLTASLIRRRRRHPTALPSTVRSSFTYAAKLLHVTLSHRVPPSTLSSLADDLLNLAAAAELGGASRLVTAARPWLADILLSLASPQLASEDDCHVDKCGPSLPFWVETLARAELRHLAGEDGGAAAAGGIVRAAVALLKRGGGSGAVAEAVGATMVEKIEAAMQAEDYDVALGLVRFLCCGLAGGESHACEFLEEARTCVELALENIMGVDQPEQRDLLESARDLLRQKEV